MVKLETSAGIFEAETVREAEKMAKRAAKLQAKQHAERESILEIARARAGLNGLRILRWKAEGEFRPRWTWKPNTVPMDRCALKIELDVDGPAGFPMDKIEIDTEHGKGILYAYRNSYAGYVENGSGYVVMIALQGEGETLQFYAVGANAGLAECEAVPGILPTDFRESKYSGN